LDVRIFAHSIDEKDEIGIINQTLLFDSFRWFFGLSPNGSTPDENGQLPSTPDAAALEGDIVSLFLAGCIPGAAIVSVMTDWIGRKWSIIVGAAFFCLGGILQAAANGMPELLAGRFFGGFGVGILSTVVGMYIAECSPATFRGTLTSGFQLMITIGIMVANIINAILGVTVSQQSNVIWRVALGIQGGLGLGLGIIMFFMPESPRHLMNKGREDEARVIVTKLVGGDQIALEAELTELRESVQAEKALGVSTWGELFAPGIWNRVLIIIILQLFQQWTGINAIMYYSSQLFLAMGLSKTMATTGATTIQSVLNVLGTFPGMYLVERLGRKTLLFWGGLFQSLWMWGLVLFVSLFEANPGNTAFSVISVILIYFYVLTFAASWGPVVWGTFLFFFVGRD
jgi:sugar porter (SP) family MFS transporter